MRRHDGVRERAAQNLTLRRADITLEVLKPWYEKTGKILSEMELMEIGPERWFNGDESKFDFCVQRSKVLCAKGEKAVYSYQQNDEHEGCTVLFTGNAAGDLAPPFVLYKFKRLPSAIVAAFPKDWAIGKSDSGWMTSETFYEYITNVFDPWLTRKKIQSPVVYFVDGHKSHFTLPVAEFCKDHGIVLIALCPNATHVQQPCDISFFGPLKGQYFKDLNARRFENQRRLRDEEFAPLHCCFRQ